MIEIGQAVATQRSTNAKFLEVQVQNHVQDGPNGARDVAFGQQWGGWFYVAPPFPPKRDPQEVVTEGCEIAYFDGDTPIQIGSRDVRFAKFLADVKDGEVGFTNAWGSRFVLQQKSTTISHGGGWMSFNSTEGTVSIVGIPGPSKSAPVFTMASGIGLVDASGRGCLSIDGGKITISGDGVCISASSIGLGAVTIDTAVGMMTLLQLVTSLQAAMTLIASHVHSAPMVNAPELAALPASVIMTPTMGQQTVKIPAPGQ